MAELVLQGVGSRGVREQRVAKVARAAGAALAVGGRAVLGAAGWVLRLGSPSLQASVSGRTWTGLPGNPCSGAWLGTGSSRSFRAR